MVEVRLFAGLREGLRYLNRVGIGSIHNREHRQMEKCIKGLKQLGMQVFSGPNQAATVSFVPKIECEDLGDLLARRGIAVRAGIHCAPLAHESAGTLKTGTVRVSYGHDASPAQTFGLLRAAADLLITV